MTDFHSIKAGMPLCTEADTNIIFAPILTYYVEYESKILKSSVDMNKNYYAFDDWIIKREDGSLVSKKRVKDEIEKIKIKDIETNWAIKYENHWDFEVRKIEENVLCTPNGSIPAFDKDYLTKFLLLWTGVVLTQISILKKCIEI